MDDAAGSPDPVARLAKERFGLDYLFPYQRFVVANVLEACESGAEPLRQAVLLPTGFGKSLCFQLPALALPRPTVVAYPLLALMEDQRRRLESLGIACALFRGGMDKGQIAAAEASVEKGEAKIIIANPEIIALPRMRGFLKNARPSHVAVDEAHCVSEWGETFRPSYLELGRAIEEIDPPALSAFTATASPAVLKALAARLFGGAEYRLIAGDPDRPNLHYSVIRTLARERSLERIAREEARPLAVFASSREGVQLLARTLRARLGDDGIRFYHAGLEKPEKKRIEEWFFAEEGGILVTTCAYGMGVDKKNIRTVAHFEAPRSVEAYLQEAGRAGRDGLPSRAILISVPGEGSSGSPTKDDAGREERRKAFLAYAASEDGCRRETLLDLLGCPREGRSPCSGCDRCDGSAFAAPEGESEIRAFVVANPRRFGRDEAISVLRGEGAVDEPPRCAHWGSMADWERSDISRALATAITLGSARERARAPWKGKLEAATELARRRVDRRSHHFRDS
jgi:ATP-dependent DNA helicase RecQ